MKPSKNQVQNTPTPVPAKPTAKPGKTPAPEVAVPAKPTAKPGKNPAPELTAPPPSKKKPDVVVEFEEEEEVAPKASAAPPKANAAASKAIAVAAEPKLKLPKKIDVPVVEENVPKPKTKAEKKEKRRLRREAEAAAAADKASRGEDDAEEPEKPEKPEAMEEEKETGPTTHPTVSICLPETIIDIAQSPELRAYFVSQIARVASLFAIDEIIILKTTTTSSKHSMIQFDKADYIVRNLQYLETPQYLRKLLFPLHPDLKFAGLMNPIECHHHLKTEDQCQYREGVVVNRPTKEALGSWVEIGLQKHAQINVKLKPMTRVTLKLDEETEDSRHLTGSAVSPLEPKLNAGLYWGYSCRIANFLKEALTQCPYEEGKAMPYPLVSCLGYDLKVAVTHEQQPLKKVLHRKRLKGVKHILMVFGGIEGVQTLVDDDEKLKVGAGELGKLFDEVCSVESEISGFGVRKVRCEEEMFITLCHVHDQITKL